MTIIKKKFTTLTKKKSFILSLLCLLLTISLSLAATNIVYAEEAEPAAYAEGTSYTDSHDISETVTLFNDAEEAYAVYTLYQNSDLLPVQVYYGIRPHYEGGVNLTMSCTVSMTVTYKALGFLWKTTKTYTEKITYDDMDGKTTLVGHVDGPDRDAITVTTVYTFNDAMYGSCTWTITAE